MNFLTTEITEHTEKEESNSLTGKIIGAAIEIHRALGPGLLESAYEACLIYELRLRKLKVEPQKSMPVFYHEAQLLSYLKLSNCKIGLLINFNVRVLKEGICRIRA